MRYRSLIVSVAGVAALLLTAVAGFFVWLVLDMRSVEQVARECQPLVEILARVKGETGRYPSVNSAPLPARLTELCHYQERGDAYVLVLTAAIPTCKHMFTIPASDTGTGIE